MQNSFKGIRQNGRVAGVPNKLTAIARESFNELLNGNLERIQADLDKIKRPEIRVRLILELAQFCLPKLKSVELNDISDKEKIQPLIIQFNGNHGARNIEL
jgi:hypothetical protein